MAERIYERKVVGEIIKYLKSQDIIIIYGARQVGKTSILRYLNAIREQKVILIF